MTRIILMLAIFTVAFNNLVAQDTIVKRNNERIICVIKEISTDEIKYKMIDNNIIFGIDKDDVLKVILSTGMTMNFQKSMNNAENYSDQKKNAVKFRLLSPLFGYSDLTYERSLRPGASIEGSLGIIGLGIQENELHKASGVSARVGYKFIKSPDFYLKGLRYAHILKGSYFEPEVAFSIYERDSDDIFSAAILFKAGKQWVFDDLVVVDFYFGIGYGYSTDDSFDKQYGYSTGENQYPVAITSGLRIGGLIK